MSQEQLSQARKIRLLRKAKKKLLRLEDQQDRIIRQLITKLGVNPDSPEGLVLDNQILDYTMNDDKRDMTKQAARKFLKEMGP